MCIFILLSYQAAATCHLPSQFALLGEKQYQVYLACPQAVKQFPLKKADLSIITYGVPSKAAIAT
jgi:hypothetical protein